jgi:ankyrin repeat protein
MLDFGVLSTPTKDGQTPFMQAIDFSNTDVVKAMTKAEPTLYEKPFVDSEDEKVTYPAIFAAQIAAKKDSSDAFEIVKLLLKGGPQSMKLRDSQGRTPLHFSVTGTSILATKWLITFGYGMGDLDNSGRTPIHNCRTTESLDILLDLDPNINQTDNSGLAPIHVAALQGFEDMVEGLIFRSADLTVAGAIGSALHCAVLAQSRRVMSLLLKVNDGRGNKLDINAVDSNGDTALHLAARVLRPDSLHLLFSYRIKKSVRNKASLTAKSQLETYHKKMSHEVVTMVDGQRVYPYPPDGEANAGKSVETSNDKSYSKEEAPWRNPFSKFRRSTATEPKSQSESDESDSEWPYSGNKRTIEEALQSMQTENEDESELLRSFKMQSCSIPKTC